MTIAASCFLFLLLGTGTALAGDMEDAIQDGKDFARQRHDTIPRPPRQSRSPHPAQLRGHECARNALLHVGLDAAQPRPHARRHRSHGTIHHRLANRPPPLPRQSQDRCPVHPHTRHGNEHGGAHANLHRVHAGPGSRSPPSPSAAVNSSVRTARARPPSAKPRPRPSTDSRRPRVIWPSSKK